MAIQEKQTKSSALPEGESGPEKDAAVAAEDKGKAPKVKPERHSLGEPIQEAREPFYVENTRRVIADRNIGWQRYVASASDVRETFLEGLLL